MSDQEPTVFIVDSEVAVVKELETLLKSVRLRPEIYLSAEDFFSHYDPARTGCVILAIRLPRVSGMEVHRRLRAAGCDLPVLFLTRHGDVATAVTAMREGAFDFIEKPANEQYLLERVQAAVAQAQEHRHQQAQQMAIDARLRLLSPRECDVVDCLMDGKTSKEIAHELGVRVKTVDFHRANIMRKLGAETVVELIYLLVKGAYSRGNPRA